MEGFNQVWTEEMVKLAGTEISLVHGGTGEPLLVLHGELGHPTWLSFHENLSKDHTLFIPSHPGYGNSPQMDWIMNMRDMAGWYLHALDEMDLPPVNVLGLSLGGWLAAEIATMSPKTFKKMAIVGSPGIKPTEGEIFDMFLVVAKEYMSESVLDQDRVSEFKKICPDDPTPDQIETWEIAREESCRLAWKPYMYYPGLPNLLRRIKSLPTLIVWGDQDSIVPLSVGKIYNESIHRSELKIIENCGHQPEIEKPREFVEILKDFFSK